MKEKTNQHNRPHPSIGILLTRNCSLCQLPCLQQTGRSLIAREDREERKRPLPAWDEFSITCTGVSLTTSNVLVTCVTTYRTSISGLRKFPARSRLNKTVSKFRKGKRKFLRCAHLLLEIRKFHLAVVQRQLRNVQKSVTHVHSSCFADINLVFFQFSLLSPASLLKLLDPIYLLSLYVLFSPIKVPGKLDPLSFRKLCLNMHVSKTKFERNSSLEWKWRNDRRSERNATIISSFSFHFRSSCIVYFIHH